MKPLGNKKLPNMGGGRSDPVPRVGHTLAPGRSERKSITPWRRLPPGARLALQRGLVAARVATGLRVLAEPTANRAPGLLALRDRDVERLDLLAASGGAVILADRARVVAAALAVAPTHEALLGVELPVAGHGVRVADDAGDLVVQRVLGGGRLRLVCLGRRLVLGGAHLAVCFAGVAGEADRDDGTRDGAFGSDNSRSQDSLPFLSCHRPLTDGGHARYFTIRYYNLSIHIFDNLAI